MNTYKRVRDNNLGNRITQPNDGWVIFFLFRIFIKNALKVFQNYFKNDIIYIQIGN